MRDLAELPKQTFEPVIIKEQRVAPTEQHVTNFAVLPEIIKRGAEISFEMLLAHPAHHPTPGAIPAVGRTPVGHQK